MGHTEIKKREARGFMKRWFWRYAKDRFCRMGMEAFFCFCLLVTLGCVWDFALFPGREQFFCGLFLLLYWFAARIVLYPMRLGGYRIRFFGRGETLYFFDGFRRLCRAWGIGVTVTLLRLLALICLIPGAAALYFVGWERGYLPSEGGIWLVICFYLGLILTAAGVVFCASLWLRLAVFSAAYAVYGTAGKAFSVCIGKASRRRGLMSIVIFPFFCRLIRNLCHKRSARVAIGGANVIQ